MQPSSMEFILTSYQQHKNVDSLKNSAVQFYENQTRQLSVELQLQDRFSLKILNGRQCTTLEA